MLQSAMGCGDSRVRIKANPILYFFCYTIRRQMKNKFVNECMKYTQLGEFEELVLLVVGFLNDNAYSISIKRELKEKTKRNPSIGALHSALNRLQKKGFIESHEGGATAERGGRRKRFYQITAYGRKALDHSYELRSSLYHSLPSLGYAGK